MMRSVSGRISVSMFAQHSQSVEVIAQEDHHYLTDLARLGFSTRARLHMRG